MIGIAVSDRLPHARADIAGLFTPAFVVDLDAIDDARFRAFDAVDAFYFTLEFWIKPRTALLPPAWLPDLINDIIGGGPAGFSHR